VVNLQLKAQRSSWRPSWRGYGERKGDLHRSCCFCNGRRYWCRRPRPIPSGTSGATARCTIFPFSFPVAHATTASSSIALRLSCRLTTVSFPPRPPRWCRRVAQHRARNRCVPTGIAAHAIPSRTSSRQQPSADDADGGSGRGAWIPPLSPYRRCAQLEGGPRRPLHQRSPPLGVNSDILRPAPSSASVSARPRNAVRAAG